MRADQDIKIFVSEHKMDFTTVVSKNRGDRGHVLPPAGPGPGQIPGQIHVAEQNVVLEPPNSGETQEKE
jgi:hypothetical protein